MGQARVMTTAEVRRVLDYVATRPHAARNRALVLMSHWAGLRAKEIAALRCCDVVDGAGRVKEEVLLSVEQTKGKRGRVVYLGTKIRKELATYLRACPPRSDASPLFPTQKAPTRGFSANTMAQFFHKLYKEAGIEGASSHSGRRSYLTSLADKGTSIHILKALAGHQSISTTAVYLFSSPSQLKAAADLI